MLISQHLNGRIRGVEVYVEGLGAAITLTIEDQKQRRELHFSIGQTRVLAEILANKLAAEAIVSAPVEHGAPICDSCGLPHNTQLDCSEVSNEEKEKVLERAREAQVTFWHSLSELEAVIGNDVDGSQDLNDTDVKTLASDDTDSSDPIGRMYSNAFKGETDNERAKS